MTMRAARAEYGLGRKAVALVATALLLAPQAALAGGPLSIGGPGFGISGQPFRWDPAAMPIQYRVDPGPLSKNPSGTVVIDHATGVSMVKSMFDVWANVPTAAISYNNAGDILPTGSYSGGPVGNAANFIAVDDSCFAGLQSPIIFDADATILSQLGAPLGVIGFADICKVDPVNGRILTAESLMNGRFLDGVSSPQLTLAQFKEALTHEFGHLSGLHHSQINKEVLNQPFNNCNVDDLAGLPLMFPFLHCQARSTVGLPTLAPDDLAWISRLYPVVAPAPPGKTATNATYGTISGKVLATDGITPIQDVNVIARSTSSPRRVAVSAVSGYLFTGNPGQNVTCVDPANPTPGTCTNFGGDPDGSRDPALIGTFDIPVRAGSYTIEVESILPSFVGGSGVGPLLIPIPNPGQNGTLPNPITVAAGQAVTGTDFVLQGTPQRFDVFENSELRYDAPWLLWLRRERALKELAA